MYKKIALATVLLLIIIFRPNVVYSSETDYTCIALNTEDVCIRITQDQVVSRPLDVLSRGYGDALISYGGQAFFDGLTDGAKSFGEQQAEQLITQALAGIAAAHGAPPIILSLLGATPNEPADISNQQVVDEINRSINRQTEILINELDTIQGAISYDIENILSVNCSIQWQESYDALFENIRRWHGYTPQLQQRTENLVSIQNAKDDIAKIRSKYKTIQENFCLWGRHVELYSYLVKLVAVENNLNTEYQAITNNDNEEFQQNLLNDLTITRDSVNNILAQFQINRTSHVLSSDEDPVGDKANAWWDDVVLDFSELIAVSGKAVIGNGTPTGSTEVDTKAREKSYLAHCERVNYRDASVSGNINSYVFKALDEAIPQLDLTVEYGLLYSTDIFRCPMYFYQVEGKRHYVSQYLARGFNGSNVYESNIIVAESFVGDALYKDFNPDQDYISSINVGVGLLEDKRLEESKIFAEVMYKEHMNYLYAQRLQMAYFPYSKLLDDLWKNSGSTRADNKLDREYRRTSGLANLDLDGLSILEEIRIGTNPRNSDTDLDGFDDGFEHLNSNRGFDPLVSQSWGADYDGDGFSDIDEYKEGTDLFDAKSNPNVRLTSTLVPIISLILN